MRALALLKGPGLSSLYLVVDKKEYGMNIVWFSVAQLPVGISYDRMVYLDKCHRLATECQSENCREIKSMFIQVFNLSKQKN